MDLEMLVAMFASTFLMALKKPELKTKIRGVALKIYRSIKATYVSDPDFQ